MGKRRIIVPNPKIEKNDIGKKDKKFNDIYTNNIETVNISTNNINTEKINGKIIDEEKYLENQFTIIYPGGGDENNPGEITYNTQYILNNPFHGYYVRCAIEIYVDNQWGEIDLMYHYYTSNPIHRGGGAYALQHNDNNIVLHTGKLGLLFDIVSNENVGSYVKTSFPTRSSNIVVYTAPARIKIWKVGKIK